MKTIDLDRIRCEKKITQAEFIASYNEGLPEDYPRASTPFLNKFRELYPSLFKNGNVWSLDQHRKKVMDWLPSYILRSQS